MRWTNYFLHPADNRYYVFTFNEEEHANRFEKSLMDDEIPYERNEFEFGIPRTHFNEALRHNHLLHADIRKPFIENKGLRWTMLIVTGATLLLALIGAFSTRAYGQQIESKYGWELAVQGRASMPFAFAGVEPHVISNDTLTSSWNPLLSQSFGVRINNRFKESWTIGTGIMWIRRNYIVEMNYSNDDSNIYTTDTINLLRAMSYRIPIIAETRVELGKGYFITAAGGVGVEFSPSDAFVNDFTQGVNGTSEPSRDYEAYLGRMGWAAFPFMAEMGFEKEPKGENPGFYVGFFWSRSITDDYWIESVWKSSAPLEQDRIQGAISSTLAGIEIRILLK